MSANNPFAMPPPPAQAGPREMVGFFGQVGTGFTYFKETTPKPFIGDPDQKPCNLPSIESPFGQTPNCIPLERNTWLFNALVGARSRGADDFFALAYYRYSFFWDVDASKARPFGNWFSSPSNPNSPLPTRGFLRVHELFGDVRYLMGAARVGLQMQFTLGRVNSALFGQEGEEPGNVYASEAFVPYLMYVGGRSYRGRLYVPMFTVVNKEEGDFTYTTLSINGKGRGFAGSAGLSNLYYLPQANTVLNLDVSYMDYKFRSVANDRKRYGGRLSSSTNSSRFGVLGTGPYEVFLGPRGGYFVEEYYLPTVIIPGWEQGTADAPGNQQQPAQLARLDSIIRFGAVLGIDYQAAHRLTFEIDFENRKSNLPVWPSRNMLFVMRYAWTTPSTAEVGRFLRNTERNPINGTFEGDGGL